MKCMNEDQLLTAGQMIYHDDLGQKHWCAVGTKDMKPGMKVQIVYRTGRPHYVGLLGPIVVEVTPDHEILKNRPWLKNDAVIFKLDKDAERYRAEKP